VRRIQLTAAQHSIDRDSDVILRGGEFAPCDDGECGLWPHFVETRVGMGIQSGAPVNPAAIKRQGAGKSIREALGWN